jgi:hypothetical protein
MTRTDALHAAAVGVLWAVVTVPYVAVGTDDLEEYFTAVATTRLVVENIAQGAWPFWNTDVGLGAPQPFRFHFITHPLAPLCGVVDCHRLLRLTAALHLLLGATFIAMLARQLTGSSWLAAAAAATLCLSSSVIQPMLVADWPITAINESSLPVMLYAACAIGDGRDRRAALMWSLVLGITAGFLASISLPVMMLGIVAIVALVPEGRRQRLPWLLLAAAITVLMGAPQVHHLYEEVALSPPAVARSNHGDFGATAHAWSAFLRPLPGLDEEMKWRTVFFGTPFAIAAVFAAVLLRDRQARPLQVGLLIAVLGFVVPPAWLFNINTAQWTFRAEVNVFGILLAVCGLGWLLSRGRRRLALLMIVAQLGWTAVVFVPEWYPVFSTAMRWSPPGRHRFGSTEIADAVAAAHERAPGRVALSPRAYQAMRQPSFVQAGLAPNQLPMMGIPTLTSVMFGVSVDELYPDWALLEGEIRLDPATVVDTAFLNALGIRYVLALEDETVSPDVRELRQLPGMLRLLENPGAWPEAYFVAAELPGQLSRLSACGHDRFMCGDFSRHAAVRVAPDIQIARLRDGLRLTFPAEDALRDIVVTQWYRSGWMVTEGRASVRPALGALVGLRVEPGEQRVTIRFRPRLRMLLFVMGLATEAIAALGIAWLVVRRSRTSRVSR